MSARGLAALCVGLTACAVQVRYVCEDGETAPTAVRCGQVHRDHVVRSERIMLDTIHAGDVAYDAGQFDKALAFYLEGWGIGAYALRAPQYETLFRAAQAARLAGRPAVAAWLYRVYLVRTERDGETRYRNTAARYMDLLATELREPTTCEVRTLQEVRRMVEDWKGVTGR